MILQLAVYQAVVYLVYKRQKYNTLYQCYFLLFLNFQVLKSICLDCLKWCRSLDVTGGDQAFQALLSRGYLCI